MPNFGELYTYFHPHASAYVNRDKTLIYKKITESYKGYQLSDFGKYCEADIDYFHGMGFLDLEGNSTGLRIFTTITIVSSTSDD